MPQGRVARLSDRGWGLCLHKSALISTYRGLVLGGGISLIPIPWVWDLPDHTVNKPMYIIHGFLA